MSRVVRFWRVLVVLLLFAGLLVYFVAPRLFASVVYPLPTQYQKSVAKWSKEYGINPNFLCALIFTESHWNAGAQSGAGAKGMTQVIPSTGVAIAKRLGVSNFSPNQLLTDTDMSIRFGAYYIADAVKRNGGNETLGLIAYNGGQGAVIAYQKGYPIRGTVAYANKILNIKKAYDSIYGNWWEVQELETLDLKRTQEDVVGTVNAQTFWQTLLVTPGTQSNTEGNSNFSDFWRNFIPSR